MNHDWEHVPPGEAATRYAQLIADRVTGGMPLPNWKTDWEYAPLEHSYYQNAEVHRYPLPDLSSELFADRISLTPKNIADALHLCYGILSQRLSPNLNDRSTVFKHASDAKWGRATASGGGRYCCDFYLVTRAKSLTPGIYHYSILEHGWELVRAGDATAKVAQIQNYADPRESYLITTIDYWRSGFKYNDFAYQAASMDTGTVAATLLEVFGPEFSNSWDYNVSETELAELLDLDRYRIGIYCVQQFGEVTKKVSSQPLSQAAHRVNSTSKVEQHIFSTTRALQDDMARSETSPTSARPIVEISTKDRSNDWLAVLRRRESSFGRFTGAPINMSGLITTLKRGFVVADLVGANLEVKLCYLVYVSSVNGLTPGLYRWDRDEGLQLVSGENQDEFVSSTYFLKNYDGGRVAASVILCSNVFEAAMRGVRSYRYVNFVIGAMCQGISLESVRHGIGTGIALGFDPHIHADHAGLNLQSLTPMLMIMFGTDDAKCGQFLSTTTRVSEHECNA